MSLVRNWKLSGLFQRVVSLVLGISLVVTLVVTGSNIAQAAPKLPTDEYRSSENTPRPNRFYDDQRSLGSYIDDAGVDRQDNLIDRSKDRLKNATDNVREKLRANQSDDSDKVTLKDVADRANNRVGKAQEVFQHATDEVFTEPLDEVTGTNR
jgi:hypothetical protein